MYGVHEYCSLVGKRHMSHIRQYHCYRANDFFFHRGWSTASSGLDYDRETQEK